MNEPSAAAVGRSRCLPSRRQFLGAVTAAVAVPRVALASAVPEARTLAFDNLHTGERLAVEYFSQGAYLPDALQAIDRLLRDFRTDEVHAMDPALLDLLHDLRLATQGDTPFQVISGYRSPATNQMLRNTSTGVASGSLHMRGQAIDIRLGGVPLAKLRDAALAMRRGGVGYYPESDFVHVDTGRVRTW